MDVKFLKAFAKDVDSLEVKHIRIALVRLIEAMEATDNLEKIPNTKKLKGHKTAYRTRIGDYRLGFFFIDSTISLARFVHRKDIYSAFP